MMSEPPRSRRQTRAAILGRLLATDGLFRPRLAAECRLTEASISRILAELREEKLVEEVRRPAPYPGGPSAMVTLRKDQRVAGLEFANDRLGIGLATLGGQVDGSARLALPAGSSPAAVETAIADAIAELRGWCARAGGWPRQIAVSIPGHGPARNPILPVDPAALEAALAQAFPGVPVVIANTVEALAAVHLHGRLAPPVEARHLFVYLGHGVGGAWVDAVTAPDPIQPIEIGHVVLDPDGAPCRCGHRGCLETGASTVALAALCGVEEAALLAAGAEWPGLVRMTAKREAAIRQALFRTGLVIGNALNLMPAAQVVLCGWPAALPPAMRDAVAEGMDRSQFGGARHAIRFIAPAIGSEPAAALAYAVHALVRQGGAAETPPARLAG
jgi:predicted NBD/HSP70 family sugar kinase